MTTASVIAHNQAPELGSVHRARRLAMFQWVTASLVALGTYIPQSTKGMMLSVFILMTVDTFTGIVIAKRKRATSSAKMRRMTAEKALQFLQIMGLGAAGTIVARHWTPFGFSISILMLIETKSILENLTWLEFHGGASLGPARPLLMKLSEVLGLGPEQVAAPAPAKEEEERSNV